MQKTIYALILTLVFLGTAETAFAGNPDRQGEAGAAQLLMNPWARSAGLHTMTTANISGIEAMRLNVAGIGRLRGLEVQAANAIYLEGTGINMNAFGFGTKLGKNGALAVTIMALEFGDIRETTTNQPEGTGATFSPNFNNIGIGYSRVFDNKISVGIAVRAVSEQISDLRASTIAMDAGVQYVTGDDDQFKLGISLRNLGGKMKFRGDGVAQQVTIGDYTIAVDQRTSGFEIQSALNIGVSYDFLHAGNSDDFRLTAVGNFTSNAFSQDQIGGGLEFWFKDVFAVRGGYKYEVGSGANADQAALYTGPAGGASFQIPFRKADPNSGKLVIDYGYRMTSLFGGTHNFGLKIDLAPVKSEE